MEADKEIKRMRFSWISGRGLVAIAATVVVLQGTGQAVAQFAPLPQTPVQGQNQAYPQNQANSQNQRYAPAQNQVYTPNQVYPQNQAYTQNLNQIYSQNPLASQNPIAQQTQIQPQYTAMAFQADGGPAVAPTAEAAAPVAVPAPMQAGGYAAQAGPGCNTCQSAPAAGYGNYANGGNGYNTFSNSYGNGGRGLDLGLGTRSNCGRKWFGGVYGLFMERHGNNAVPLAFSSSTGNPIPYYPADNEITQRANSADIGYQSGLELRIGATFGARGLGGYLANGTGNCDSCGSGSCGGVSSGCGPTHAWEAVYWGLFDDSDSNTVTDITGDGVRLYGMIDFRGLEYDPGTGYRPVNVFYDYGPPTTDNTTPDDIEVRSLTVRSTFSAQNLELNLLRMPTLGGGGSSRHQLSTFVGARFLRLDEDFYYAPSFQNMTTNVIDSLAYNAEVDNQLYGLQMGLNGTYRLGSSGRWSLYCNSAVGLYGNSIEVTQRMDGARYVNGTQADFNGTSTKDDVSMIGELRLGGSYQYSTNWRFFSAWRVLGVSGIAVSTDQIRTAFITPGQTGVIDSNGSMIIHGLQSGVEFTY